MSYALDVVVSHQIPYITVFKRTMKQFIVVSTVMLAFHLSISLCGFFLKVAVSHGGLISHRSSHGGLLSHMVAFFHSYLRILM